jgi:hypothetical protein
MYAEDELRHAKIFTDYVGIYPNRLLNLQTFFPQREYEKAIDYDERLAKYVEKYAFAIDGEPRKEVSLGRPGKIECVVEKSNLNDLFDKLGGEVDIRETIEYQLSGLVYELENILKNGDDKTYLLVYYINAVRLYPIEDEIYILNRKTKSAKLIIKRKDKIYYRRVKINEDI